MIGMKFGRWTVVGETPQSNSGEKRWQCRCDWGTERSVLERSLLYGGSVSCGCLRKENARRKVSLDLSGQTFGELTVIHKAEYQRKNGGIWWTCQSSCGNTYDVPGTLLVNGRRTHCSNRIHERNYISDLRFLPEPDVIKVFLKYIPSQKYSIDDWNQTAWYLVGKKVSFSSELEVRDYIINSDLPRLL